MHKRIEGVEKAKNCIRGDIENMERGICKKIDQSMTWMKETLPKLLKSIFLILTYQLLVSFVYLASVSFWILW